MRIATVLLAAGEPWEAGVLAGAAGTGVHVLKRCVDLTDLLATAACGQVQVAVVSTRVAHLDGEAVQRLRHHDVPVVAVGPDQDGDRMTRLGVARVVAADAGADPAAVLAAVVEVVQVHVPVLAEAGSGDRDLEQASGRTIAVWGPAGAPGRTSLSLGIAAELAAAGRRVTLVDADPYGGTVAARLGVLDEASGLLVAARAHNAGTLDADGLVRACRRAAPGLDVLTGLPRADRRIEVRPGVVSGLLELAAGFGDVVVDTGFCIEAGERDRMTTEALAAADVVVAVGLADPVGLARLARGLDELAGLFDGAPPPLVVVLNRFRPGHGWSLGEVQEFLGRCGVPLPVRVIGEDGATMDRALASGRTLVELGLSRVRTGVAELARACVPEAFGAAAPKRRRAGTARLR